MLAVNHSGNSDSTGAITGNICGALYGVDSIPARWLDQLELRNEIEMLANDLAVRDEDSRYAERSDRRALSGLVELCAPRGLLHRLSSSLFSRFHITFTAVVCRGQRFLRLKNSYRLFQYKNSGLERLIVGRLLRRFPAWGFRRMRK